MHKTQKRKSNLIIKWAKDINRHFTENDILIANKHTKICSESSIRKIQIKTTMRYPCIPTKMAYRKKKKKTKPNADKNEEKLDYLYIAVGVF